MDEISKYFTVKKVAKRLDVTEDWVRDLIQSKQLKAVKVGKWRVDPEELKKFIQDRTNIK
jgi:excisionase family DNA binding protein